MATKKAIAELETRSLEDLIREWRFAPLGSLQAGDPYADRLREILSDAILNHPDTWARASKAVGW
jgi:hypothetical protein